MTTTITAAAPDIESLVRDYYIDSSRFIYYDDYYDNTKKQQHQQEWSNEEHEDDRDDSSSFCYRYCDICMLDRAGWLKYYCYGNKGLNRQLITIWLKCMDKYNHKKYEQQLQRLERFVAENNACLNDGNGQRAVTIGGVIDIITADNAKDQIMLALKLAMNTNNNNKYIAAITSDVNEVDDDYLFCKTVRMAYDQSELVRRYFRNNPSKISPNNARLWPLRYQAYKEYGILANQLLQKFLGLVANVFLPEKINEAIRLARDLDIYKQIPENPKLTFELLTIKDYVILTTRPSS